MSSAVPTSPSNPSPRRRTARSLWSNPTHAAHADPIWFRYWIPLILVAATVWVSHYRGHFPLASAGEEVERTDAIEAAGETSRSRQLLFLAFGGFGGVLLLRPASRPLTIHKPLATTAILLCLFLLASVFWSDDPNTTARRLAIVYLVVIAAIAIARTWTPLELCRAAMFISSAFLIASIFLEMRAGTFLRGEDYRFSGAFHPNRQALNCGILTLSSLILYRHTGSWKYLLLTAVGIVFTTLTSSRGGLIATMVALAASYWFTMSAKRRVTLVIGGVVLLAAGMMYFSLAGDLPDFDSLSKMGRADEAAQASTLTGRIPIWIECVGAISNQPLLGYGYGAFWTPKRVQEFSYIHDWAFSNAHSVYLETALNIGIAGAMLALGVVVIAGMRARKIYKQTGDYGIVFILALLCMGACSGLAEAIFASVGFASTLATIGIAILAMHPIGGVR